MIPAMTDFRQGHYHRPGGLNGRVRNGNGCDPASMVAGNAPAWRSSQAGHVVLRWSGHTLRGLAVPASAGRLRFDPDRLKAGSDSDQSVDVATARVTQRLEPHSDQITSHW